MYSYKFFLINFKTKNLFIRKNLFPILYFDLIILIYIKISMR